MVAGHLYCIRIVQLATQGNARMAAKHAFKQRGSVRGMRDEDRARHLRDQAQGDGAMAHVVHQAAEQRDSRASCVTSRRWRVPGFQRIHAAAVSPTESSSLTMRIAGRRCQAGDGCPGKRLADATGAAPWSPPTPSRPKPMRNAKSGLIRKACCTVGSFVEPAQETGGIAAR